MKLIIIGYSGAGKTTLANALAKRGGFQVFHVDEVALDLYAGRCEASEAMRNAEARMSALRGSDWVIDGYQAACIKEEWIAEADRIVFFDVKKWTCFWRAARRLAKKGVVLLYNCVVDIFRPTRGYESQQPVTNEKSPSSFFILVMKNLQHLGYIIREGHSPQFKAYYMSFRERYPEKFVVLRSRREVRQFRKTMLKEIKE